MKIKCRKSNYPSWGLFTEGKEYEVISMSPNGLMVYVLNDEGKGTMVVFNTSAYGKFEILGDKQRKNEKYQRFAGR